MDCPCSTHSDCGSLEICVGGECQSATGKVYKVTMINASINYNDHTVDVDYSNPDPYVNLYFPNIDTVVCETSHLSDTLEPVWNEYCEITVTASGQSIWFCMYDDDGVGDDPLYFEGDSNCKGYSDVVTFIRVGEALLTGTSDVNYLNVSIELK